MTTTNQPPSALAEALREANKAFFHRKRGFRTDIDSVELKPKTIAVLTNASE